MENLDEIQRESRKLIRKTISDDWNGEVYVAISTGTRHPYLSWLGYKKRLGSSGTIKVNIEHLYEFCQLWKGDYISIDGFTSNEQEKYDYIRGVETEYYRYKKEK